MTELIHESGVMTEFIHESGVMTGLIHESGVVTGLIHGKKSMYRIDIKATLYKLVKKTFCF